MISFLMTMIRDSMQNIMHLCNIVLAYAEAKEKSRGDKHIFNNDIRWGKGKVRGWQACYDIMQHLMHIMQSDESN